MRRAWLLLLALAALAVAWLTLRDGGAPAPVTPPPEEHTVSAERAPPPRGRAADERPVATQPARAIVSPDPGRTLTALVVDADGRPCGRVQVLLAFDEKWGTRHELSAMTRAKDGVAWFGDVSRRLDPDHGPRSLTVALPFADPPRVSVDIGKPSADPVRLVLPRTGRVRCEVVDLAGVPVDDDQRVLLRHPTEERAELRRRVFDLGRDGEFGDAETRVDGGAATFMHVGLGLELEAEVPADDGSRPARHRFAGPARAGEETVVRIVIGGARPTFTGRLVDTAGAPVAEKDIVGELLEPGRPREPLRDDGLLCTTDEAGRFSLTFDRDPGPSTGAKLRLGRRVSSGGSTHVRPFALLDLPASLGEGATDVGDVVLAGTGLLVAGVVVDAAGTPLRGAAVRVLLGSDFGHDWPDGEIAEATTDAEGRFRIGGDATGRTRVPLGAALDGWYLPGRAVFAPGTADARVEMHPAGGIAGSVKIPEGVSAWRMEVRIQGGPDRNGDGGQRWGEGMRVTPGADGTFEVRNLRPGKATVVVQLGWSNSDMDVVVEGVEVVAGQVTRDPRLVAVDPAKGLRELTVTVVDAEERPLPDAKVHWRRLGGGKAWEDTETGERGTAKVRLRPGGESGVTVIATARGHRSTELMDVRADATLVLVPAKPVKVRVRYAEGAPLPEPPFEIGVTLAWAGPATRAATPRGDDEDDDRDWGDPRTIRGFRDRFGNDRVVVFDALDPGMYRVELTLWEIEMSGGSGIGIATVPAHAVVTVAENSEPVEIVVGVDPGVLSERMKPRKR